MANIAKVGSGEWIVRGNRHHLTIRESFQTVEHYLLVPTVYNIICWYGAPHFIGKEEGYHTISEAYDVAAAWIDRRDAEIEPVRVDIGPDGFIPLTAAEEMNLVLHREYRNAMDNVAIYQKAYNDLHKKINSHRQELEAAKKYKDVSKSRLAKMRTLLTDLEDNREHMYRRWMDFKMSVAHMKSLIQTSEGLISGNPDRLEFTRTHLQ